MKKLFVLLSIIILFISCKEDIDEKIKNICIDIIENPYKILYIEDYYPSIIKRELMVDDFKDSQYRIELIKFLNDFNRNNYNYNFYSIGTDESRKRNFIKYFSYIDIDSFNVLKISTCKNNDCIKFQFLIKDTLIYLVDIYQDKNYYIDGLEN